MTTPRIRAGTGVSRALDAFEAGRSAAAAANGQLGGEPPAVAMVFTTPRHNLEALLSGVRSVTGPAILVGATASGEIVQGEYLGFGEGVGVLAMTSGAYRFGAASASHIRNDLDRAGQAITRESRARAKAADTGRWCSSPTRCWATCSSSSRASTASPDPRWPSSGAPPATSRSSCGRWCSTTTRYWTRARCFVDRERSPAHRGHPPWLEAHRDSDAGHPGGRDLHLRAGWPQGC